MGILLKAQVSFTPAEKKLLSTDRALKLDRTLERFDQHAGVDGGSGGRQLRLKLFMRMESGQSGAVLEPDLPRICDVAMSVATMCKSNRLPKMPTVIGTV